jgi:hypothetical protein
LPLEVNVRTPPEGEEQFENVEEVAENVALSMTWTAEYKLEAKLDTLTLKKLTVPKPCTDKKRLPTFDRLIIVDPSGDPTTVK